MTKQEFDESGAVQPPAEHRAQREAAQRNRGRNGRPAAVGCGEPVHRQIRAGGGAIGDRRAADQNDQRSERADDDRIDEDLEDAEQTLTNRIVRVRARVRDRRGAESRFV